MLITRLQISALQKSLQQEVQGVKKTWWALRYGFRVKLGHLWMGRSSELTVEGY
jgi:hypothetical protein